MVAWKKESFQRSNDKYCVMSYQNQEEVMEEQYFEYINQILDRNSEIIGKQDIIRRLRKYSKVSRASLPRDIDLSIKNGVLKVFIKNTVQNMQVDSAALEGWILVLKTWLSGEIKYVELDFEAPKDLFGQYGYPEACHYNRFLYRLNNMLRLFPGWFFLHKSKVNIVSDFMRWIKSSNCLLNHSLRERESVIKTKNMERQIESWFAFEEGKEPLCKLWEIDKDKLFNQLPVGVFYEKIASKNAIFTRGTSAIDLWGIGNDGQTLHLIELKCGNNKGIGVISEILFYAAVIYDFCISEEPLFSFGKYGKSPDTTDMIAIKNSGNKFDRLFAHILAEKYHPLFSTEVESLIREGLSNLNIKFDRAIYDYSKKVLMNENNDL